MAAISCFHLAFPSHDFEAARAFYIDGLGGQVGRSSEHAMILNLGGNQIVAHKAEAPLEMQASIYPRHFGLIFFSEVDYQSMVNRCQEKGIPFHVAPKVRFPGKVMAHHSFFVCDPSNNLLEFKHYLHREAIFGAVENQQVGEKI